MGFVEYFAIFLGVVFFATLGFLIWLFLRGRVSVGSMPNIRWKIVGVIVGALMLFFWAFPWMLGEWWETEVVKTSWITPYVITLIVGSLMLRRGSRPFSEKFGAFIVLVLIIGAVWNFTDQKWVKTKIHNGWVWVFGDTPEEKEPPSRQNAVVTGDGNNAYWNHINNDNREVAEAALEKFRKAIPHDRKLAMQVNWRESRFRQFEPDGETVLRNHSNPDKIDDVGVCQIHETAAHLAKSKELSEKTGEDYSLDTLEGNLNMCVWIWLNEGPESWTTLKQAKADLKMAGGEPTQRVRRQETQGTAAQVETVSVITKRRESVCDTPVPVRAPIADWTEPITTNRDKGWKILIAVEKGNHVRIRDAGGQVIPLDEHPGFTMWNTPSFTVQTRPESSQRPPDDESSIMVTICKP